MYNKKLLSKIKMGKSVRPNPYKKDIIVDPMGQWNHPGKNTRIPSSSITMKGVNYPVLGVSNTGQKQMMQPGREYNFPGADYVDEYPQMKKGGAACPSGQKVYPDFKDFGCLTQSQYDSLKDQKTAYLNKRNAASKKIIKLKNAGDFNAYANEVKQFKTNYPNQSYVCPGPDCPKEVLKVPDNIVIDPPKRKDTLPPPPNPIIEKPIELPIIDPPLLENKDLGELQIHDYSLPDSIEAPQYKLDPYTADRLSLDVKLPQNKIAALFDKGVIDSKGHIALGKRNKTRLIPRMVQKLTGYDPAYFEGYEDEEGNFVPGELDYGNVTGSEMEFRGAASLRDFMNQQKYKKEYADYDKKLDTWLEQYEQSKKKQEQGQAFKKGGAKKKYTSDIINSTNYLFAEHPLFKKKKQSKKRIYSPKASYYQDGGEQITYNQLPKNYQDALKNFTYPEVVDSSEETGYDAAMGVIKQNPNDPIANVNNPWWMEHELMHHLQNQAGAMSTYGTVGQRPNPYVASDEAIGSYYDRRGAEFDIELNKIFEQNPDISEEEAYALAEENLYRNPTSVEGEARNYEGYIEAGNPSIFPKQKTGGQLSKAKYGHSIGNLIRKQDGGQTDYNIGDEVDEATMQYLKKLGFTFEKI